MRPTCVKRKSGAWWKWRSRRQWSSGERTAAFFSSHSDHANVTAFPIYERMSANSSLRSTPISLEADLEGLPLGGLPRTAAPKVSVLLRMVCAAAGRSAETLEALLVVGAAGLMRPGEMSERSGGSR